MVYLVYYLIFSGVGTITDKKRTYNLQIYGASEMKMSTTDQRSHTDWELTVYELFIRSIRCIHSIGKTTLNKEKICF